MSIKVGSNEKCSYSKLLFQLIIPTSLFVASLFQLLVSLFPQFRLKYRYFRPLFYHTIKDIILNRIEHEYKCIDTHLVNNFSSCNSKASKVSYMIQIHRVVEESKLSDLFMT